MTHEKQTKVSISGISAILAAFVAGAGEETFPFLQVIIINAGWDVGSFVKRAAYLKSTNHKGQLRKAIGLAFTKKPRSVVSVSTIATRDPGFPLQTGIACWQPKATWTLPHRASGPDDT